MLATNTTINHAKPQFCLQFCTAVKLISYTYGKDSEKAVEDELLRTVFGEKRETVKGE